MHECNNNFAFPSHSSIYTAILNIHCFFFLLVYMTEATLNAYNNVDISSIPSKFFMLMNDRLKTGLHTIGKAYILLAYGTLFIT